MLQLAVIGVQRRIMNIFRAVLFLVALAPILSPGSARAGQDAPAKDKTVRLLTVGNSFSQNATRYLDSLAKAAGDTLIHRPMAIGGASMEVHWEKAKHHERDPRDPRGLYGTKSLSQELMSDAWDYVTIQQASIKSHSVATYRPFAKELHDYIKKAAPKAEILVHQTWAYRVDDPRFSRPSATPGEEPATQKEMYEGLTRAYGTIAAELKARLIPVGDAFYLADNHAKWGYKPDKKFDFKKATPPSSPDQTHSLHTGWRWVTAKDKKALTMDGHHASVAGQYLAACVFYEALFAKNVVGNTFIPPDIDRAYARFLQETAHQRRFPQRLIL